MQTCTRLNAFLLKPIWFRVFFLPSPPYSISCHFPLWMSAFIKSTLHHYNTIKRQLYLTMSKVKQWFWMAHWNSHQKFTSEILIGNSYRWNSDRLRFININFDFMNIYFLTFNHNHSVLWQRMQRTIKK